MKGVSPRFLPAGYGDAPQGSASPREVPGACAMPSPLLAFPVFHSKGPQNMDLFNLTTPSVSLTGAEMVPKVKEEPMTGGNGDPGLQTPHPGSKPSLLLPAPCREGATGKRRAAPPDMEGFPNCGQEGDHGAVGASTGSHHYCCLQFESFLQRVDVSCVVWPG